MSGRDKAEPSGSDLFTIYDSRFTKPMSTIRANTEEADASRRKIFIVIALVTALLVAETGNPLFWFLPAVVGQVPIAMAKRRLHAIAAVV